MGRLPHAWIAPPETRELRELVRHQDSRHGGCVRIVASRLSCGFPGWSRFGPRHDAKKLTKALCTEFAGTRCNPGGRATAAASNGPDGRAPINALCLESWRRARSHSIDQY